MRWAPWRKEPGKTPRGSDAAKGKAAKAKQRPQAPGDEFLRSVETVVRRRGFDAAEQLIGLRMGRLWARLSMLAEPTDPERAIGYGERSLGAVNAWLAWVRLQRPTRGDGVERPMPVDGPVDDLAAFLRDLPLPVDDQPKPALPEPDDRLLHSLGPTMVRKGLDEAERLVVINEAKAWNSLSKLAQKRDMDLAVEYAQRAYDLDPRMAFARRLQQLLFRSGQIIESERLLRSTLESNDEAATPQDIQQLMMIQGWKSLFLRGFPLPDKAATPAYVSIPDTSLYCLHNSLPYSSAGYAMRSHGLLRALQSAGISVVAGTRYGYPWDLPENRRQTPRPDFPLEDVIEDVRYRRSSTLIAGRGQVPMDRYIQLSAEEFEAVARDERPSVIHAASNFLVGLAAIAAGRRVGIPVIYEVRGLWEVTHASRHAEWEETEFYQAYVQLEAQAAREADRVIAITHALKDELVRRGVPGDHIEIVPNCVDATRFTPEPRDRALEQELGLAGKRVVGYIGSFTDYEGLDHLLYALSFLVDEGVDNVHLLLVGDGLSFAKLQALVTELELEEYVTLTGRISFDEVHRYYSLIDIAPFPRKPLAVTEMVSPLKPFEAMAMEKAVLVSSVAALSEIVEDGATGLIFEKGNIDSLAAAIKRMVADPELCTRLGRNAREWVIEHRSWDRAGEKVAGIYRELTEAKHDTSLRPLAAIVPGREGMDE